MNRGELSSVILKLIGFTVVVHAILGLAVPIVTFIPYYLGELSPRMGWGIASVCFDAAIRIAGGLLIISKSPAILAWLFAFGQDKTQTAQ